ncbi:MAG: O-antigen ligase family protein [Bacteroidetes bacterium]|nr:MAG: O-antigen ligase family protein [Bacteroidota bacterium]
MSVSNGPVWLYRLYAGLFLLLPWSIELSFGNWKLLTPAEPLLALAGIGLLVVAIRDRQVRFNALAPVSMLWIAWMGLSAAGSSMPVVSWKYWLVEAGQWWVFFMGILLFPSWWPRLSRLFAWSLTGVVLYTVIHHGYFHFRPNQSMLAPHPFFADHTVYSTVLVLVLWGIVVPVRGRSEPGGDGRQFAFPALIVILLLVLALFLAVSRAAWLSLILTGMTGLLIRLRVQWYAWAAVVVAAGGLFFLIQGDLEARLQRDVSTQERLNRYACAWRMVADRPFTGFGPGTFQFQFLPYQQAEDMTRISITEPIGRRGPGNYGRGGGAHSEYLQALAELGWPGLLWWLMLTFGGIWYGLDTYRKTRDATWLWIMLALLSFFLHGLVNNFLHDARVAALVWSMLALVSRAGPDNSD